MIINKSPIQTYLPAVVPTGKYRAAESQVVFQDKNEKLDGTSRLVIGLHGHGADSLTYGFGGSGWAGAFALARTGRYYFLSIDAGGPAEWGNANAQQAILDAVTWARGKGVKSGKYGLVGWSMGGLAALIHIGLYPTDVAGSWLWVPGCDTRYFQSTGYSQPYGGFANSNYSGEIATAYAGQTISDTDPMQNIGRYQGINVPSYFALASDDTVITPEQADYFLAQVNNPSFFLSPKGKQTGGHTGMFNKFTRKEFVAHFDSLSW